MRTIVAVTLVALTMFIRPTSTPAATLPANMNRLISTADDLYARAAAIVARTPSTRMGGAMLANPSAAGGQFYARERAFQDAISALPTTGENESSRGQATVRLGQFDNFVHSAVVDALASCNRSEARANLRVAHELLEELHRIAAGRGRADWDPPGLDAAVNAVDASRCS